MIDDHNAKTPSAASAILRKCLLPPALNMADGCSLQTLLGLPLLYASAYFLPLCGAGSYFLPSNDVFGLVVLPTLLAVLVGAALIYAVAAIARLWCPPRVAATGAIVALALLVVIGLKGIANASGYDWEYTLPSGADLLNSQRRLKIGIFVTAVVLVWGMRGALPKLNRLLTSLGFALGALAAIRLLMIISNDASPLPLSATAATSVAAQSVFAEAGRSARTSGVADGRSRRVVWVIFDETDFARAFDPNGVAGRQMTNFNRLSHASVFATDAHSPASATLYSIPALLTGIPLSGEGVMIDKSGFMSLRRTGGQSIPFSEDTSIFGAIRASGRSSSTLGFYHPYCKLFRLERCDSFPWPDVGRASSVLWSNIPGSVELRLGHATSWESITRETLALLPQYLSRDDALTFIHINVPHPPAPYADAILHFPESSNTLTEYSHNLLLADQVLGNIVGQLETQSSRHELLLVVSTDHWLRNMWYQGDEREVSRPVPLIIWKVGNTQGYVLSHPLSTVHTAPMILEYLNGNITSQEDIAQWWVKQPFVPTFIPPNT